MRRHTAALAWTLGALALGGAAYGQGAAHALKTTHGGGEIMTNEKVMSLAALVKSGALEEPTLIRMIQSASRTQFDLTHEGVLELAEAGVSDKVINVMLDIWEKQRKYHDQNIRIYIQMLRTDRQDEYDRAVRELVSYGGYAVPLLVENLRHEDERIRAGACQVLGRIADPASLDALFQALVDRNKAVRARAARAVSAFGAEEVGPRLAASLERRGLPRDGFALALGYVGGERYLDELVELADDPGEETDRAAAAYALGLIGRPEPEALDVLKGAVLDDTYRELREAASRALALLAPRMERYVRADVASALVTAMKRFAVSRDVLALQLRHFPTRRVVEALLEQIDSRDKDVAGASWESLKSITGEILPQDPDQWRAWWEIARVQPRWREVPQLPASAPEADEMKPLPEIPGFEPSARSSGEGRGFSPTRSNPLLGKEEAEATADGETGASD
jgi:HEAT repeat protein